MGKKAEWFRAVKKLFSPESTRKKKEARLEKKLESGASEHLDSCPNESLCEGVPPPMPHPEDKVAQPESEKCKHASSLAINTSIAPLVTSTSSTTTVINVVSNTKLTGNMREEIAAIKIQTAFRGHLARRALRALRGLLRLKSLVDGNSVQRQAMNTLRCMQMLARVQSQIRSRRIKMLEENQILERQTMLKHEKELESLKNEEEWDGSLQTKQQIDASLLIKQEAAIRRERAMAYAFSHQRKSYSKPVNPMFMDPTNLQWGWSWLERCGAGSSLGEATGDSGEILKNYTFSNANRNPDKQDCLARTRAPSAPHTSTLRLTRKTKPASSKHGLSSLEDDSRSTESAPSEHPRSYSSATVSTGDDESLASSVTVPSYTVITVSARAKFRFQSLPHGSIEASVKPLVASMKKKQSFPVGERYASPASPSVMRWSSGPSNVGVAMMNGVGI